MSSKYTGNGPSDDRFEERDYTQYTDYPGDDYAEFEDVADDEYVEDYVDEPEYEEYAGAHRRREDDGYDDDSYDDGYAVEREAAGSTAAAAGGVPKRGLAMILIAVAALLLLWGIFALTQKDDAENSAATTTPATTGAVATDATATATTAVSDATATATDTLLPPAPSTVPDASEIDDPNVSAAPTAAPVLDGGPAVNAENAQVFVYNNSQRDNAAVETAAALRANYSVPNYDENNKSLMNMQEQHYGTFAQTTVLYDPRANGAREVAETIARQVGGVVLANDNLPERVFGLPEPVKNNRQAITVVIAGQ